MKIRTKIAGGVLTVLALAVASFAVVISHSAACQPAPVLPEGAKAMKAVVYRCYGSADVLRLEEIEKPVPAEDEILVKVAAASVNPLDWHYMRGSPYFMRLFSGLGTPEHIGMGVDFAGVVESVGGGVTRFRPGDKVFGGANGAFAEYVTVGQDRAVALIPDRVSFEQAAAVPIAGITALQALRDKGKLAPGQKVLINGGSGGVGTFAVQIAGSMGAEVSAVCSTRNVAMVKAIGADHVFDYTRENYTESGHRYDLIVDMVGNHSIPANTRVLAPTGTLVLVGAPKGDWIRPLLGVFQVLLYSPFTEQELVSLLAELTAGDLEVIAALMASGQVTPVIDRRYSLEEVSDAIRYSEAGHARGKILIKL